MKILVFLTLLALSSSLLMAQTTPVEIAVGLKTPDGKYIGQVAQGGLDATATVLDKKTTFVLVDLNGGKVSDGDSIKIKFEASEWHEEKETGVINRVPSRAARPEETTFKLRIKDKLVFLETGSGKFVKITNGAVVTTGDKKEATLLDIQSAEGLAAASPVTYTVALKFPNENLFGMVAGGLVDASSKALKDSHVITVVDLNGGGLVGNDPVKVLFGQTILREDPADGKIHRVPLRGHPNNDCTFKIIVVGQNVALQTPTGKFVAIAEDGKSITTTATRGPSSLMTVVPSPTVAAPVK